MANPVQQLQQLGFGEYEARAYVALLKQSPMNGYELAKASGIPRANIYSVLQKLEERGAVLRLTMADGTRYSPVVPDELTERLRSRFDNALDDARQSLGGISAPGAHEYVWNAEGYPAVLEHARALLDAARKRLLVAIRPPEARALAHELASAEKRQVDITTLCLEACPEECGNCRGRIFRYQVVPDQLTRWLVVVSDNQEALAGEIGPGEEALAVRTRQRLLVDLASWYTRHSIALAAVLNDLGTRLENILKPETQAILRSVGPGGQNEGWLEQMRQLLSRRSGPAAS